MASRLAQLATSVRAIPPTPFRSGSGVQLSDALDAVVTRSFGLPAKAPTDELDGRAASLDAAQEIAVEGAADAVRRLEDASALKEFPVSSTLLHPRHDPQYYSRMREGVHRAQQGIERSWWKRFFQIRGSA